MAMKTMRQAVIISAVRTPVAKARGVLAGMKAERLGGIAIKAAVERAGVSPGVIEEMIFANINNLDLKIPGRFISLDLGYPLDIPSFSIDRACGASLNAASLASMLIETGNIDAALAGGVEHSTSSVFLMDKPAAAFPLAPPQWCEIKVSPMSYENLNMGQTAERIAERYGITRRECDEYALLSHRRAAAAWEAGFFDGQIVPVTVDTGKGTSAEFSKDDIYRSDTSIEALSKLRPSFKPDGIVTAGNSSPFCDGASALVLMEKERAAAEGCGMMGAVTGFAAVGVEPQIMGIGPVYATRKLLKKAGMTLDDIDLIEINEAFASQTIACIRELALDMDKINVNGGAIALGHPFGATGAILVTKILYELRRRDKERGLVAFCIGGGQGIAALIERV